MKQNNIAIRCITKKSKGFGNFSRCLVLAKALRKHRYSITFLINKNKFIISKLRQEKFAYFLIPDSRQYSRDSIILKKFMEKNNVHMLILDMREYGEKLSKQLYKENFKIALIDDAWVTRCYADAIINGTISTKYHKYSKIKQNSKFFVGPKYFITDPEFQKNKKKKSEIKSHKKYNIIISMGGADPKNVTSFVIKCLHIIKNVRISAIVGPFFTNTDKIEQLRTTYPNIRIIKNPNKIWNVFKKGDLVISNSGNTLYELAIMHIPSMCITSFKHEIPYANAFSKIGVTVNLGKWNNITPNRILSETRKIIGDHEKRKQMSCSGKRIIDGNGINRVVRIISELIAC